MSPSRDFHLRVTRPQKSNLVVMIFNAIEMNIKNRPLHTKRKPLSHWLDYFSTRTIFMYTIFDNEIFTLKGSEFKWHIIK